MYQNYNAEFSRFKIEKKEDGSSKNRENITSENSSNCDFLKFLYMARLPFI